MAKIILSGLPLRLKSTQGLTLDVTPIRFTFYSERELMTQRAKGLLVEAGCRNFSKSSKMDVRGVGADGNMTEIILGMFVMEHEERNLDDEDLLLLSVAVEVGDSRGFLTLPLEIPARPDLSLLGDKEFLIWYRFTRRQVCWIQTALAFPASFSAPCRTTWSSMEGLLILLRRLSLPARLSELCTEFGRSTSS